MATNPSGWIIPLDQLTIDDVGIAGGKNASLGEMIRHLGAAGVRVPGGFAVTARAYWHLVDQQDLRPAIEAVGATTGAATSLRSVGARVREAFRSAPVGDALEAEIRAAYEELCDASGEPDVPVAVRSSATAEDLPEASFAGQQESFLNVRGADAVVEAYHRCVVSLFGDRAIAYRTENGFDHLDVALSVGIQRMVRSDTGSAGVIFTIDPENGFPHHVLIDAAWGLGEAVVSGVVDSDRYRVFKPLLDDDRLVPIVERSLGRKRLKIVNGDGDGGEGGPTATVDTTEEERNRLVLDDADLLTLARWAVIIENHYGRPMDIEWAKDGVSGELFVVQARPETVQARRSGATMTTYDVTEHGPLLLEGLSVGGGAATGEVCRLDSPAEGDRFPSGAVLVADATDPDWVPVMQRAAAVVTNRGGRTSHAAIVSRELGVPAVVGTVDATSTLAEGRLVTVSCAGGDVGRVFDGGASITARELTLDEVPSTRTDVMVNLANPGAALSWWRLPVAGIGLARMEFIIGEHIRAHPMALAHPERLSDPEVRRAIDNLAARHATPAEYFVDRLASGIATLAATWADRPMILRMSDFKTNEYASLLGGEQFEPTEANPMLGWRGASRYFHPGYRDGFALECRAVARVRNEIGLTNVIVMIPFCRTPEEADRVLAVMAEEGLERGVNGLKVEVMAEIPANVIRADEFADRFDGFSIGSNDLTQLTLGVDRDSAELAAGYGADDPAVLSLIRQLIAAAHAANTPVGFCGQAPSNDPAYARLLVEAGIDSVSVTPDAFADVSRHIAEAEGHVPQAPPPPA
ncbi:MAG: phosphoenolpyruvate synthase [Microthrixaceae bacterium]